MSTLFLFFGALLATVWAFSGCREQRPSPSANQPASQNVVGLPLLPDSGPSQDLALALPLTARRYTGDLEVLSQKRNIRALVVYSRSGFFYDKGHPKGISYEAVEEFGRFVNKKLKTGNLRINMTFIPVKPGQLKAALTEGLGDFIATGVVVTPERQQEVAFTIPIATDTRPIVVTGPTGAGYDTIDNLSGKKIYVNPLTNYYENLQSLNVGFRKAGRQPVLVEKADSNLTDEDLLEMVNSGLIPATVTFTQRADFWSKVFSQLVVHPDMALASGEQLAWVTRKDSPKLKQLLDDFMEGHRLGTSFGNTLFRRYLKNTKWVKDSTASEEMKKFQTYVTLFHKYATQYRFDYLMLAAQGYQESMLDQNRRSPRGAVGIMQVIPKYAAASPINIKNVNTADGNIHAAAKILHDIQERYFDDPGIDITNKTLMTFAAYNAGPTRISNLRKRAKAEGLDPNQWFGGVELVVAKDVGQETVQYVGNIYKYYVAYKLILEQSKSLDSTLQEPQP